MLSCKKAAVLLSQQIDGELGGIGQIRLRGHLLICGVCRTLNKQLQIQKRAARVAGGEEEASEAQNARPALRGEARDRIKSALREKK